MRIRPRFQLAGVLAAGTIACIVGVRAEAPVEGRHALDGVGSVQIELPSTPLAVVGCTPDADAPCPERLGYVGVWRSFGATKNEAMELARTPALQFERTGPIALLRADIPADVRGLVDLEIEELELPENRDLMLRTDVGDVEVFGMRASVIVDVEQGDVTIFGADGGVGVRTRGGSVDVTTPGHADLEASHDVELVQSGGLAPLRVLSRSGDVRILLGDDANLDLEVTASGRIVVQTPAVAAVTSGSYERKTGAGAIEVRVEAQGGNVEIALAPR